MVMTRPDRAGTSGGHAQRSRTLAASAAELLDEARGRRPHDNPVAARTGGAAGNARLTAWLGALLLVVLAAEAITLLDVRGLVGWHVGFGVVLVALTLAKTATTTWRVVRYYTGHGAYRKAGPPPTPLRMLGPLLVVAALGVLGSGLTLLALGPQRDHATLFTALGQRVDPVTVHQAFFVVFAVAVGLHVLARAVPALQRVTSRTPVPGGVARTVVLVGVVAVGLGAALILAPSSWM